MRKTGPYTEGMKGMKVVGVGSVWNMYSMCTVRGKGKASVVFIVSKGGGCAGSSSRLHCNPGVSCSQ
jgi:hypothetical protein